VGIRRRTLESLDKHWNSYTSRAKYLFRASRSSQFEMDADFVESLRRMAAPTKKHRPVAVSDCFYPSEEIRDLIGDSADYIEGKLENLAFLDSLKISYRLDVATCITRLEQLKRSARPSTQTVQRIYRYLERIFDKDQGAIAQAFRKKQLIYLRGEVVKWLSQDEVTWTSHGEFLDSLFPPLANHYRDFHGFFVRKLGVPGELTINALVAALPSLSSFEQTEETRTADAMRIYQRVCRELTSRGERTDGDEPVWLDTFRTKPVFLNHKGAMVSNDGSLFVDDIPDLSALFRDRHGLSFFAAPRSRLPQFRPLLDVIEVPYLSAHIAVRLVDPGLGREDTNLTAVIRERRGLIARVVYQFSNAAYERAKVAGKWLMLSNIEVIQVPELTIVADLNGESASKQGDVKSSGQRIFIRTGIKSVVDHLATELCVMLDIPLSVSDGISRVLLAIDEESAQEYLEMKGMTELPDEDELPHIVSVEVDSPIDRPSKAPSGDIEDVSMVKPLVTDQRQEEQSGEIAVINRGSHPPSGRLTIGQSGTSFSDPGRASPVGSKDNGTAIESFAENNDQDAQRVSADSSDTYQKAPTSYLSIPEGSTPKLGWNPQLPNTSTHSRQKLIRNSKNSRLLSYADAPKKTLGSPDQLEDGAENSVRLAISAAAVSYFIETQASNWAKLEEMAFNNRGYDIRAITHDGVEEYIEVKGQAGPWTEQGVILTRSELLCAAEHRQSFWLCVVQYALDSQKRSLYLINNPFGMTDQFRYDSGWKGAAVAKPLMPFFPSPGLQIQVDGEGKGRIVSAKRKGPDFYKLHIQLEDGRQIYRVYDPSKMQLIAQ